MLVRSICTHFCTPPRITSIDVFGLAQRMDSTWGNFFENVQANFLCLQEMNTRKRTHIITRRPTGRSRPAMCAKRRASTLRSPRATLSPARAGSPRPTTASSIPHRLRMQRASQRPSSRSRTRRSASSPCSATYLNLSAASSSWSTTRSAEPESASASLSTQSRWRRCQTRTASPTLCSLAATLPCK
jgi:hypothetical protein